MTQPKCFVISPIGAPGSDVRAHADDVFDYVIKPVVEELGYFVHRGDHNARPGKISDQMYDSEKRMLYTPYGLSDNTYYSPTIQCDYKSALYIAQQKEFDFVWRANATSAGKGKK